VVPEVVPVLVDVVSVVTVSVLPTLQPTKVAEANATAAKADAGRQVKALFNLFSHAMVFPFIKCVVTTS
jgi:hypothetical protein